VTAPTIPTSAAELEEMLLDDKRIQPILADAEQRAAFFKSYAAANAKKDPTIEAQIEEGLQRGLAKMLKDAGAKVGNKTPVPLGANPLERGATPVANRSKQVYNKRAPGVALDDAFDDAAEFFQAIWHKSGQLRNGPALADKLAKADKIQREIYNAFGSTVPSDGGFLIPETLRAEILSIALETAIVRPRATVIPMESLKVPIPTIDSTSNVSSVWGGITCYWTEEATSLTASSAKFGRVYLEAKKLTGYSEIPNELIADASAFGGFFNAKFPQAVAFFEDVAFMSGSGAGEPLGFINCPAAVISNAVAAQGANTIVVENLAAMFARMLPTSLPNAVWIADIGTFPQLATMALSVGTGGGPVWMGGGATNGIVGAPPMSIYGRPLVFTEKSSVLGTTGDINFVDLSYYLVGDRQVMQTDSSAHYKFASDMTAFRVIERVDGRPWLQSAITPKNNGNSLSPFVQLSSTRT
jgi:HK97 family phage major capsid protein